jgi:uncharacterized protein
VRVVVDTNAWVSGLIVPENPPGKVLEAVRRGTVRAVASWGLARELVEVLARPGVRRFFIEETDVTAILVLLSPMLPDVEIALPVRDPDDLPVLASALAGGADAIVTGDRDLLDDAALRAMLLERGIEVLTPVEMLSRLKPRGAGRGGG